MNRGRWWWLSGCLITLLGGLGSASAASATHNPEHWSLELRGGVFGPSGDVMKSFFGTCCSPTIALSGGPLIDSKLGIEVGLGMVSRQGRARGEITGRESQDGFSLLLLPVTVEVAYRIDYHADQPLAPYVKAGLDGVYFRESSAGQGRKGFKMGLHGGGGLMILLNDLAEGRLDAQYGFNDIFFVIDGRYRWANSFGKAGFNLSGWEATGGVHLQF